MQVACFFSLTLLLSLSLSSLQAQSSEPLSPASKHNNALVLGLAGNAPLLSLSYHRQLIRFQKANDLPFGFVDLGVGLGLEITEIGIFDGGVQVGPTFPHSLTLNVGKRKHFLEVGYGGVVGSKALSASHYIYAPLLGWRYKSPKGFLFRLYFATSFYKEQQSEVIFDTNQNPILVGTSKVTKLQPMIGLSLGKAF